MTEKTDSAWNSKSRVDNSQRWREASAAMGRHLTAAIVDEAHIEPNQRVLDLACGTGEPAISIASLMHETGRVVGADISAAPLAVAEQRARERGLGNIEFQTANALDLPFPDRSFNRVTCRLGVMFFSDPTRALSEVCRVLKSNGRASFLAWGPMQQPYFDATIGVILRAMPELEVPASAASMFKFGKPGTLRAALRDAGFKIAEERVAHLPWNWPGTPEDLWEYFQEVTVPFKPIFNAIPDSRRNEIVSGILAALRARYDGKQVKFDAEVVLASGTPSD